MTGAVVCVLLGALMAWGVHGLWQLGDTPVTSTFQEQMMHRKTRTMEQILDGLVRGKLHRVEESALQMKSIGVHLNWYSSSSLYENHDEIFRDSTTELIEAAQNRDHDAAKESALRLERSCIECHALINRPTHLTP
ncbi:MAG: hypothetical protein MI861_27420 [Pirellulales bacterium]|nr:hypothetical protein [Pirellulales bacterium]